MPPDVAASHIPYDENAATDSPVAWGRYDHPHMMRSSFVLQSTALIIFLSEPAISYGQSFALPSYTELSATSQRSFQLIPVVEKDETLTQALEDNEQGSEYGTAREIKRFTRPTILLRGTAESIGLDNRALANALQKKFLEDFAFLQSDFAFDKTYETWEIGLFECEAWTVGSHYPVAIHIQCAAGSMDEPRHWHYANLGYGPKDKIGEMARKALDAIVAEYAAFVRQAHGGS